ncbi:copper resistance system multicopper oxidase [Thiomicrorhabdus sp. zzn3]|uniref:copper resistance system multicopper oxidase n=1 Tax=Thiomicrorhabdus sp. zzn3 TaxID=3039775 RepID=UPI002436DD1E|nr:copper resistance system multicopper oxidase [Thiomicrorhabdus sp. zzn3]MDG6778822.1 copper resistance system multicopper oxidase [Thiomicrorhabdus sp. zzn3]
MKLPFSKMGEEARLSRRTFIKGAVAGSALAAVNLKTALAAMPDSIPQASSPQVLSGTEFHLDIVEAQVNFTGQPQIATTVNGMLPSPTLMWQEGDEITLHVTNHLQEDSSIHWHGIILPFEMDGVPGLTFDGIKPGETFTYRFKVQQHGTYWYHSHSGFQEQTGMYGAIVIVPKESDPYEYQRDYVIQLSDWSDEDPHTIQAKLKKMPAYYNFKQRTLGDFFGEVSQKGFIQAFNDRKMWNEMAMSDRDLSDVTGYTYTFLMNGISPATHWRGLFKKGEKIRLRFINSSAMTFFDVRIPGLKMTVIAADGNLVQPVEIDEFRIGVAETYDVLVEPQDQSAYCLFAQAIDRSGYAVGSLTTDTAITAEIPEMDPLPILTHADMGMGMGGHHMGHMSHDEAMQDDMMDRRLSAMDHSAHDDVAMSNDGPQMDHTAHVEMNMSDTTPTMDQPMDHSMHSGHANMNHTMDSMSDPDFPVDDVMSSDNMNGTGMDAETHLAMGHDSHAMTMVDANTLPQNWPVEEAQVKWGAHTNMRAESPQYRLSDPGVGLRNNGRKVLTYADLKNLYTTRHDPQPDREIVMHLTGNMERYMWSIDGVPYSEAEPMHFKYGERIRITFINNTMMNHPMHLHGMWSDLESGDLNYLPRKHTVIVQPGSKISYRVTVDAKGVWAYHCHMLFHMSGMFRKVIVA